MQKKQKINADMSMSDLAGMVARGFTDLEKQVGDQVGSLAERIDSVEERLTARITNLEKKVDLVRDGVNELAYEFKKMRSRIENLELKVFGSVRD